MLVLFHTTDTTMLEIKKKTWSRKIHIDLFWFECVLVNTDLRKIL